MVVSIFVLGALRCGRTPLSGMELTPTLPAFALGPLFLGPLSEIYGRTIVLQTANLMYFGELASLSEEWWRR